MGLALRETGGGQVTNVEAIKRRLYLLECLNPAVVTIDVATDAKWAVECMKLLAGYAAASPAAHKDERVVAVMGALL
jgi:hypothetical protein